MSGTAIVMSSGTGPAEMPGRGRPELLRHALSMWVVLTLLGLLVVLVALALLAGRHRRRLRAAGEKRGRAGRTVDAWAEAGRRMQAPPPDEAGSVGGGEEPGVGPAGFRPRHPPEDRS